MCSYLHLEFVQVYKGSKLDGAISLTILGATIPATYVELLHGVIETYRMSIQYVLNLFDPPRAFQPGKSPGLQLIVDAV